MPHDASLIASNMPLLTSSALLSTLYTHLNARTQLIPTLHAQLGLPQIVLEDDELQTLQIYNIPVESQMEVWRKQVDATWIGKCEGVDFGCALYSKALGTQTKVAGALNGQG